MSVACRSQTPRCRSRQKYKQESQTAFRLMGDTNNACTALILQRSSSIVSVSSISSRQEACSVRDVLGRVIDGDHGRSRENIRIGHGCVGGGNDDVYNMQHVSQMSLSSRR